MQRQTVINAMETAERVVAQRVIGREWGGSAGSDQVVLERVLYTENT